MESRNKALSHLRKNLRSGRGEELPMQKVSVMAPDKKGLEEGLKKAEDLMKSGVIEKVMKPEMESEESSEMESEEEYGEDDSAKKEEYMAELEGKSIEDLKKMIVDMKCEQKEMM
jgi:hypothetical protein